MLYVVPKVKVNNGKYPRITNVLTHPLVEQPVYGQGVPYDGDHHQAWQEGNIYINHHPGTGPRQDFLKKSYQLYNTPHLAYLNSWYVPT